MVWEVLKSWIILIAVFTLFLSLSLGKDVTYSLIRTSVKRNKVDKATVKSGNFVIILVVLKLLLKNEYDNPPPCGTFLDA